MDIVTIVIFTFTLVPFLIIFGCGGMMLTLTFLLIGVLDKFVKDRLLIQIIGLISTFIIVYVIVNMITYIIYLFIEDMRKYGISIYKKRSFWYMCIITFISYFYYNICLLLKDDYIYH